MYTYKAHVIRVIDGDTAEINIKLGFDIEITKKLRIIAESHDYFDTPESYRPKSQSERSHGNLATARAVELLEGKDVIITSVKFGKYRYIGKIQLGSGEDYGDKMIKEGFQKKDYYSDEDTKI